MNGCSKSVSPIYSSLEVVDNPHIMKVYFTKIDTGTIFAVRVKIRCLIIKCVFNGKKFQNVIFSFKISKDLYVCVSGINKISTVLLLPVISRVSLALRYDSNFMVTVVWLCSDLWLFVFIQLVQVL